VGIDEPCEQGAEDRREHAGADHPCRRPFVELAGTTVGEGTRQRGRKDHRQRGREGHDRRGAEQHLQAGRHHDAPSDAEEAREHPRHEADRDAERDLERGHRAPSII